MSLLAPLLTAVLAASPPASPSTSSVPAEQVEQRFRSLLLASEGLDPQLLDDALGLRLPDLELLREWQLDEGSVAALGRYAFVHLARAEEEGELSLELITADGEAFVRSLEGSEDQERLAASFVVSLLASIEAEELEADRVDIQAPTSADQEEVERAVTVAKGEEAPPDPEPEPEPEPEVEPEPEPKPPPPPAPVILRWELAVQLDGGGLFSLPDLDYGHIAAGGGSVGVFGRGPTGVLLGAQLRVLGRERAETSLVRVRVAGLVGYAWRPEKLPFELPVAAVIGFEPWFLRQGGEPVSPGEIGTQSTLTNLGLWLAPGYLRRFEQGPLAALRVGGHASLGTAFVIDGGFESIGLSDTDGEPLYRLGGLELGVGLDLAFYLRPRAR